MIGMMRPGHRWTIRRFNGKRWCFELVLQPDATARTALAVLSRYREPIHGGGTYRAFIEQMKGVMPL